MSQIPRLIIPEKSASVGYLLRRSMEPDYIEVQLYAERTTEKHESEAYNPYEGDGGGKRPWLAQGRKGRDRSAEFHPFE
jgi:hypothetical protein